MFIEVSDAPDIRQTALFQHGGQIQLRPVVDKAIVPEDDGTLLG